MKEAVGPRIVGEVENVVRESVVSVAMEIDETTGWDLRRAGLDHIRMIPGVPASPRSYASPAVRAQLLGPPGAASGNWERFLREAFPVSAPEVLREHTVDREAFFAAAGEKPGANKSAQMFVARTVQHGSYKIEINGGKVTLYGSTGGDLMSTVPEDGDVTVNGKRIIQVNDPLGGPRFHLTIGKDQEVVVRDWNAGENAWGEAKAAPDVDHNPLTPAVRRGPKEMGASLWGAMTFIGVAAFILGTALHLDYGLALLDSVLWGIGVPPALYGIYRILMKLPRWAGRIASFGLGSVGIMTTLLMSGNFVGGAEIAGVIGLGIVFGFLALHMYGSLPGVSRTTKEGERIRESDRPATGDLFDV